METEKRRRILKDRYYFDCECENCADEGRVGIWGVSCKTGNFQDKQMKATKPVETLSDYGLHKIEWTKYVVIILKTVFQPESIIVYEFPGTTFPSTVSNINMHYIR